MAQNLSHTYTYIHVHVCCTTSIGIYCIAGNFHRFSLGEILSCEFLSCVIDYIEPTAIFSAWVKIYSSKCFL